MKLRKNSKKTPPQKESLPAAAELESMDDDAIPTLTEIVAPFNSTPSEESLTSLQAELSARVQKLAEELLHSASREMEAVLLEKVCDRLRDKLPELIDETVRSQLK